MTLLTKDTKDIIDKSPQKATDIIEKLHSSILHSQKIFHEIPDSAPDNVAYHSPFINDFKHISWYFKTIVKSTDLKMEKNQVIFDVLTFGKPTKWEFYIDGNCIETLNNVEMIKERENVYRIKNFLSRRPLHTSLLKSTDQISVNSDVEVYFYIARVTKDCTEAMLSMENAWLFDVDITPTSLSKIIYPIKSIKFSSKAENVSLRLGNVELVNIPRKLFLDSDGSQTWTSVDHRGLGDFEDSCLPPSETLNFDPEPDHVIVTCKRTLIIDKDGVKFI